MRRRNKKPESVLAERIAIILATKYPKIPYHFDGGADVKLPVHVARALHKLNSRFSRGHPDLAVYAPRGKYHGLFLELKATDEVPDTEHTRRQAWYHSVLRKVGYKVTFCCGYDDCKKKLKKYMKLKKGN